jgi:hypothetical protein
MAVAQTFGNCAPGRCLEHGGHADRHRRATRASARARVGRSALDGDPVEVTEYVIPSDRVETVHELHRGELHRGELALSSAASMACAVAARAPHRR